MKLNAYLSFPGTCEEALNFYKDIFGGSIAQINRYDDSPMASEESNGKVLHTEIDFGDGNVLMAADVIGQPLPNQSNINLFLAVSDETHGRRIFNELADGGKINFEFAPVFWGSTFGMLTDKFGINWMINCHQ